MADTTLQKKPLPFVANFAAGAIAGISEILTFYPLDVVKTRMQLETGKSKQGVVGAFRTIIKEEGFGRLYRGLVPPLLMEAPKRATKFAANDFWGKQILTLAGDKKMTQPLAIATGCAAGATESFVVVPFELVKIKLQDKASKYAGPIDVVKQVVKNDGLLGLYAGMEATMWRHFWWNGGYFGCIFQVRALLPKPKDNKTRLLNDLLAGTVGGLVVKSRIQGASKVPGVVPKYNWTYPALVTIFREEGPAALYKGFVPKVLRLAPGGGVLLLVVEFTLNIFRQALGPPYV
ncbi:mitochondrial carrier [Dichomitus squalens LYAD-421 SS1]|uniref:Mitochondrial carrier n=1 Tax=Dichomitus squalens (strain LYAD-421) TaxID=732165 RepID=R7SUR7_DICSQ|nr:mitochondrial carrier [Dichomitus squalens LYAD-421 SS1]EJF58682.1 mitochondrial carrier [Dichomitus squalens LYAD-421 SS1]